MANQGRKPQLNDAVLGRIVASVRKGDYYETAAGIGGVTASTFWKWMRRGEREPESIYGRLRHAIQDADADAESAMADMWRSHMPESWQAARDYMSRRWGKRWRQDTKLEVEVTTPIEIVFGPKGMEAQEDEAGEE